MAGDPVLSPLSPERVVIVDPAPSVAFDLPVACVSPPALRAVFQEPLVAAVFLVAG